jgi:hypothetical protein
MDLDLDTVNTNKLFIGIMMIVMNIGSRHLMDEFSASPEEYSRNLVLRRIAIFALCFVATRDIVTALLLTAGFIIIATGVSLKSREGMVNQEQPAPVEPGGSKADNPAYDTSSPLLFKA